MERLPSAFTSQNTFPLLDVPDLIWKKLPDVVTGGRDIARNTGPEHPNHYADVDQPPVDKGDTLLKRCLDDPEANVTVEIWRKFYTANGATDSRSRGLIPFRVWQIFKEMTTFLNDGKYDRFLAAAGVLSHYVGDACQPLHGSYLSDGFREKAHTEPTKTGKTKQVWPGKGVHSAYEDKMIDRHAKDLFPAIETELGKAGKKLRQIKNAQDAAIVTVQLMGFANETIDPETLVRAYVKVGPGASAKVVDALWKKYSVEIVKVMAEGTRALAHIWDAAWRLGKGDDAKAGELKEFTPAKIRGIYEDEKFVESLDLDHIGEVLK